VIFVERVQHPETEKPEKDLFVGVNDPGFKVPLDDPGKKSHKKSFENLAGPASHSSPVEHSELDISSGGADSEGYVGDLTVDESLWLEMPGQSILGNLNDPFTAKMM